MQVVGLQRSPDHISKFTHFFHLMALYSIVEYWLSGTMEFEFQSRLPITKQVRWASESTDVRDRMIPMYSAVALLLIQGNNKIHGTSHVAYLSHV
jgi:hypothetical protein